MTNKCPKCNSDNPDTLKFCGECGTQLPESKDIEVTETIEVPKEELTRGTTFAGRYEIIEELGKGGMGRVYRVEDTKLEQEIALKLIKPEIAKDKKTIERFRNELKLARNIRHKNVCGMFDLGEIEGAHFITMEYVRGEDLRSLIRRIGQLPIGKSISITNQICEGLAEAHRQGVVHRDLKSNNIMIDKEGNVRIMDFGIARSLETKGITGAGVMIGTPEYMSPEQVEGKEVDQRSDIYSLGVILYEMVTGRVPFEGDTPFTIGMKHKGETPKNPKEFNNQIPDDLSCVILRCLEKDKEKRCQSADEVRSELIRIEQGIPSSERVIPKKRPLTSKEITVKFSKKWAFLVMVIVVILAAALAIFLLREEIGVIHHKQIRIVVLPFENEGSAEDEYFVEGISDEIRERLSRLRTLGVISRASSKLYKNSDKTNKQIKEELDVKYILRGQIFWDKTGGGEGRISVRPELIHATDDTQIWSKSYESVEEEIFTVQSDIPEQIIRQLDITLSKSEYTIINPELTDNFEAYQAYLRGLDYLLGGMSGMDAEGAEMAISMFEHALRLDPLYVMAYARLSEAHSHIVHFGHDTTPERFSLAKDAVNKAVELDPDRPEIHLALGRYYYWCHKNYEQALNDLFYRRKRPSEQLGNF
jgi:TolB-like protein/predicted Ser/Thr protein kinase